MFREEIIRIFFPFLITNGKNQFSQALSFFVLRGHLFNQLIDLHSNDRIDH